MTDNRGQIADKKPAYKKVLSFEDLAVFQRAYKISINVHKESMGFPKKEQFGLAEQLRRATKSICANIAEGYGKQKQSKAEFRRFLSIALGSCDEVRVWVCYCYDLGYINSKDWEYWRKEYRTIARMIQSLINKS